MTEDGGRMTEDGGRMTEGVGQRTSAFAEATADKEDGGRRTEISGQGVVGATASYGFYGLHGWGGEGVSMIQPFLCAASATLCTTICQLHLFCARFDEAIWISQKPGRTEPAPPALHFEVFLCSCVSLVRRSFSEGGCFPAWLSPWGPILLLRLAAPWFIPALDRSPANHRPPSSALSPFPRAASRKRLIGDDSPYPTRPFSERVGRGIPAEPDCSENTFLDAIPPWILDIGH